MRIIPKFLKRNLHEPEVQDALLDIKLEQTRLDFQKGLLRQKLHALQDRCSHERIEVHCQMSYGPWEYWKKCLVCEKSWDVCFADLNEAEKSITIHHEYPG